MRAKRFKLKRAVTPDASSYAASSTARDFRRSTPTSSRSPDAIVAATPRRNVAASRRVKLPTFDPSHKMSLGSRRRPSQRSPARYWRRWRWPRARIVGQQRLRALFQHRARDVDRHVVHAVRCLQPRLDQRARLGRRAGAELHEQRARAGRADDLGGVRAQDGELGAGQVVLGQRADLLEQRRSLGVVEVATREAFARRGQAGTYVGREIGRQRGVGFDQRQARRLRRLCGGRGIGLRVPRQPDAAELPARVRREEVAIADARVRAGVAHEAPLSMS